jgi:riboflavin synthase
MFTGIVQDVGTVTDITRNGDWRLTITPDHLSLAQTAVGASMSCAGICLTIIERTDTAFQAQASTETLNRTTMMKWKVGTRINLEPALRMGDELGGHIVTGHIDGIAYLVEKRKELDSVRLRFEAPPELRRYIAPKGSVALDGVSLTVNEVEGNHFGLNIIPHTQAVTTLGALSIGDAVNLEADMMARYAERLLMRE